MSEDAKYENWRDNEVEPDLQNFVDRLMGSAPGELAAAVGTTIGEGKTFDSRYEWLKADRKARERLHEEEFEAEVAAVGEQDWVRRGASVLKTTEIPFIIKDRIHQVGIGQLAAQQYQGKTLVGLDLALSVANGLDSWMGYPIEKNGVVVYVAAEGGASIQVHIDAWLKDKGNGVSLDNFILVDEMPIDWTVESSVARLEMELGRVWRESDDPIVLVVGDTQIDLAGDTDENTVAMGHVFRNMRRWAVELNLFFLLMHHMGHTAVGRGRGHSSQFAKADVLAVIEEKTPTDKVLTWTKVKGCAKPTAKDVLTISGVPGSKGAVIKAKDPMAATAEEAGRLSDMEEQIVEAVKFLKTVGIAKIGKNHINGAKIDDGKIVRGSTASINSKVDGMVYKGWLTHSKSKGYDLGSLPTPTDSEPIPTDSGIGTTSAGRARSSSAPADSADSMDIPGIGIGAAPPPSESP